VHDGVVKRRRLHARWAMLTLLPAIKTIGLSFKTARLFLLAQKEKKMLGQVSEYDNWFYKERMVGRTKRFTGYGQRLSGFGRSFSGFG